MWLWAYSSLVCSVFLGISPVMNPPELLSFVEIPTCAMELAALNKTKKTAKSLQRSLSVIFNLIFSSIAGSYGVKYRYILPLSHC